MTDRNTEAVAPTRAGQTNRCLAALSADAMARLKPHLKEVVLEAGAVLWEEGRPHRHAYFPMTGLVSVTVPMQDGAAIEVGTVGAEGAAGGLDTMASGEMVTRGTVLIGGTFAQIGAGTLADLARQSREIDDVLRACRAWLYTQAQQLAACNATHPAEKRLCRWLMGCQQRVNDGRIYATQETIGSLLGIRRTTVTLLAQDLHTRSLIDYTRGKIAVHDTAKLEAAACECCANLGPAHWPSARLKAMRANAER